MIMKKFKSETEFTKWFCDQLQAVNALTIAFVGSTMQVGGIPDRYICHRDFHGWIEFKKDRRKVTTAQRIFIQDVNIREGNALVVRYDSRNDLIRFGVDTTCEIDYLFKMKTDVDRGKEILNFLIVEML